MLSDLPPGTGDALRKVPGVRVVAAEVWKVSPPIDGRGGSGHGRGRIGMLTRPKEQVARGLLSMVEVEGQDLAAHARLKNVTINHSILPTSKGGGRMLNESDVGKPHVAISTKIAGDYPNADGSPKRVGQAVRLGSQDFTIVGLYNTGSPLSSRFASWLVTSA